MASKNIKCPHCCTEFKISPVRKSKSALQAEKTKEQNKAIQALKFWEDTTYLSRIKTLERQGEYGYAFLNLWNRIETGAKLCYYFDKCKVPNSVNSAWGIWNNVKTKNKELVEKVLSTSQSNESLQNIRNLIVHQTKTLDKDRYERYCQEAQQFLPYVTNMLEEGIFKDKFGQLKESQY